MNLGNVLGSNVVSLNAARGKGELSEGGRPVPGEVAAMSLGSTSVQGLGPHGRAPGAQGGEQAFHYRGASVDGAGAPCAFGADLTYTRMKDVPLTSLLKFLECSPV